MGWLNGVGAAGSRARYRVFRLRAPNGPTRGPGWRRLSGRACTSRSSRALSDGGGMRLRSCRDRVAEIFVRQQVACAPAGMEVHEVRGCRSTRCGDGGPLGDASPGVRCLAPGLAPTPLWRPQPAHLRASSEASRRNLVGRTGARLHMAGGAVAPNMAGGGRRPLEVRHL